MNKMKRRDLFSILFVCLAVACLMTACMNSADETTPQLTNQPNSTNAPAATQPAPFDWNKNSETVEANIKRISELSDARVVTAGNTALVAVRFSSAYQGEMTSRIREMIAGEVMKADPSIKTVAVTAENEDVTRVYDISDRMRAGNIIDTIENDINEIVRNATTLT